jgi:hypothetical protein
MLLAAPDRSDEQETFFSSLSGAPEEIRTPDPQIRSLVLYPAELRALTGMQGGLREIPTGADSYSLRTDLARSL